MDTKWTSNNGSNSDNPNHLGSHQNNPQSTNSAVTVETEKQSSPISNRLDSGRGNDNNSNNRPAEHSDSTMSNPVNDKVDTSEKSSDSTKDNASFDLSYFDGIYKTKEKDDPLDLSYFESPYDKGKLEEYLKSNVESGNQLAYNSEDFTEGLDRINNIQVNSNPLYEAIFSERESYDNAKNLVNSILSNIANEVNERGRISDRKLNALNMFNENIDSRERSNRGGISSPYDEAFRKLKREVEFAKEKANDINNSGVTKNTGISANSERQQFEDRLSNVKNRLRSAYESGDPVAIENAKRDYERVANRVKQDYEGSSAIDFNWMTVSNPEAFYQKMEDEFGSAPTSPETPSEPARTEETSTTERETPRTTEERPETPTTSTSRGTESETPETPTEVAMGESESEIPEEIDEEPSEETHTVIDAMEGLDDSRRWWEFGSEDYERTRHQIARISPTAEEEFMDFADLINDIVNGSAGDKVKAVLKLISKAAWDTFNILPKVCVDVAKDIVYRLIKGDYDTSGLTEGEQKQVERFSHNRQNVNMMNAMLNTMDKPIDSSIRGKGRGQVTDESDYNEGITDVTNDVVSDVTKKYIISQPWLFKAIQRW